MYLNELWELTSVSSASKSHDRSSCIVPSYSFRIEEVISELIRDSFPNECPSDIAQRHGRDTEDVSIGCLDILVKDPACEQGTYICWFDAAEGCELHESDQTVDGIFTNNVELSEATIAKHFIA